jgi:DNA topoisomerase-3
MARKDIDVVINACDAGREGELIFTYIYELAGCKKAIKRLWLSSMTTESIREGFLHLRNEDEMLNLRTCSAQGWAIWRPSVGYKPQPYR